MANKEFFCEFRPVEWYLIILRLNGPGLEGNCYNFEISEIFVDNY